MTKQNKSRSAKMKAYWAARREVKREAAAIAEEVTGLDMVNHPPHYTSGKFEVIDVLEDWFATEPLLWQVGKYIARWDKKGDPVENLEKAVWYLNRKISNLKKGAVK